MFKANFIEKVDPDPYPRGSGSSVVLLTKRDIPDFLNLQQQIWNDLPLRKKDHLKVFSVQEIVDHMDAGMPVLAIRDYNGGLLAQAVLSLPFDKYGNPYLDDHPMLEGYDDGISVLESLCVRPDVAHQHLADMLLAYAQGLATQQGSPSILAKVSDEPMLGAESFDRSGFVQTLCELNIDIDIPVHFYQWLKFRESDEKYMDPNNYPEYLYDMH